MAVSGAKSGASGAAPALHERAPLAIPSASELLAKQTLRERYVNVPEWGFRVKVRELSMGEYEDVKTKATDARGNQDDAKLQVYLVCAGIVEPDIGDDAYEWVRGQSVRAVNRVMDAIIELSGLGPDALEDTEAMFPAASGDNVEVPDSA